MKLPSGYSHPLGFPPRVFRLQRALYGLKQAPQSWFAKFSSTISQLALQEKMQFLTYIILTYDNICQYCVFKLAIMTYITYFKAIMTYKKLVHDLG